MGVLDVRRSGSVIVLELNRPKARNALNEQLLTALASALEDLQYDDTVRAVILHGASGVFCAGADIAAFESIRQEALIGARRALGGRFWSHLATFAKPVIAAVEGLALGGGLELALACDVVIAAESAKFGLPEVKLGVIPGGSGTQRLTRAVGKSKAMAMLLTGDFIDAETACTDGIVARVVGDGETLDYALAMAGRIAKNSPLAVALAKDAALQASQTSLTQGLEHEKRNFYLAMQSADSHEGEAAFLAKRAPKYTGR
ncbi:MAG: enoyl-CoA hydratase-related protein [Antricoccus sp.]